MSCILLVVAIVIFVSAATRWNFLLNVVLLLGAVLLLRGKLANQDPKFDMNNHYSVLFNATHSWDSKRMTIARNIEFGTQFVQLMKTINSTPAKKRRSYWFTLSEHQEYQCYYITIKAKNSRKIPNGGNINVILVKKADVNLMATLNHFNKHPFSYITDYKKDILVSSGEEDEMFPKLLIYKSSKHITWKGLLELLQNVEGGFPSDARSDVSLLAIKPTQRYYKENLPDSCCNYKTSDDIIHIIKDPYHLETPCVQSIFSNACKLTTTQTQNRTRVSQKKRSIPSETDTAYDQEVGGSEPFTDARSDYGSNVEHFSNALIYLDGKSLKVPRPKVRSDGYHGLVFDSELGYENDFESEEFHDPFAYRSSDLNVYSCDDADDDIDSTDWSWDSAASSYKSPIGPSPTPVGSPSSFVMLDEED